MNLVLAARSHLDLPQVPPFELLAKDDVEEEGNPGSTEVESKTD